MAIKILIADDHALLRQGIKRVLNFEDGFEVIGEAEDGQEAVARTLMLQPDILLLDINMPGLSGLEGVKQLKQADCETRVIALTIHDSDNYVLEMLKNGALGYLLKDVEPAVLIKAIHVVNGGDAFVYPELAERLFGSTTVTDDVESRAKEMLDEDITQIPDDACLLRSHSSLGHGISEDITDVVYVKYDDNFSAMNNFYVADDIERINRKFLADGTNYVLIGPGRWGSSDQYLGVPVKWPHISAARVIVEVALKNYRVDPSQGTHFFQNLTSFGVGYLTIDTNDTTTGGIIRKDMLDAMPAVEETEYVRHVRFDKPLKIMMDGKKQEGLVIFAK
jgi:DNA-binding NarL/FixJ family response regulator